jgi:small subunit ribosomal protein S4
MIVHGHIAIDGRRVTVPGYIVSRSEESNISYYRNSPFKDREIVRGEE